MKTKNKNSQKDLNCFVRKQFIKTGGFLLSGFLIVGVLSGCSTSGQSAQVGRPDLEIKEVEVSLSRIPDKNFNYFEYNAIVKIKNNGAAFRSDKLFLNAGNAQINQKLSSKDKDYFEMSSGEEVEVPYKVLLQNQTNEKIVFQIDAGNDRFSQQNGGLIEEEKEENNFFSINIL